MAVKTYSPQKVSVIVAGIEISGYADGTFVSIEPMGDGTQSVCGADGEIARTMSADDRHKVTLTLMASSNSNDVLTALYYSDKATASGIVPMLIKDLLGSSIFAVAEAWITNPPKKEYDKKSGDIEWVFETGTPAEVIGGSSTSLIGRLL